MEREAAVVLVGLAAESAARRGAASGVGVGRALEGPRPSVGRQGVVVGVVAVAKSLRLAASRRPPGRRHEGRPRVEAVDDDRREREEKPAAELVVRLVEAHEALLEDGPLPGLVDLVAHRVAADVALDQLVAAHLDDLEHEVEPAAD